MKILPCPFCGSKAEGGVYAAMVMAVVCTGCGAKIERAWPDSWPKGVFREGEPFCRNRDRLGRYVLKQCVEAWNRRE